MKMRSSPDSRGSASPTSVSSDDSFTPVPVGSYRVHRCSSISPQPHSIIEEESLQSNEGGVLIEQKQRWLVRESEEVTNQTIFAFEYSDNQDVFGNSYNAFDEDF